MSVAEILVDSKLDSFEWGDEPYKFQHVIPTIVTSTQLLHAITGEVTATVMPGYKWAIVHQHPHVVPIDFTDEDIDRIRTSNPAKKEPYRRFQHAKPLLEFTSR